VFIITVQNFMWGWQHIGALHLIILGAASLLCIGKFKIHPGFVVLGALVYGAVFLAY